MNACKSRKARPPRARREHVTERDTWNPFKVETNLLGGRSSSLESNRRLTRDSCPIAVSLAPVAR